VCAYDAQKNTLQPGQHKQGVIPPYANAEVVWAMEDVLAGYTRLYDPQRPQMYVDETRKPLVAEPCTPIPATPGQPR